MGRDVFIIGQGEPIVVTGGNGFIGSSLVDNLLGRGFRHLRCFVRPSSEIARLEALSGRRPNDARVQLIVGNLLSREDCSAATKDAAVIYHLAAGTGQKSFPDAFMNSVVTTRNLLEACLPCRSLRRFVSVSSFAVYSNTRKPQGRMLEIGRAHV